MQTGSEWTLSCRNMTALARAQSDPLQSSPARHVDIAVFVDITRALPSQLESDRCQVLGGSLHDDFPHCAVACVEDVVKPLFQKLCGLRNASVDDREQLLVGNAEQKRGLEPACLP